MTLSSCSFPPLRRTLVVINILFCSASTVSVFHRLPPSHFPAVHLIQPAVSTSELIIRACWGAGAKSFLCNPIQPVEVNGGANWEPTVQGPASPTSMRDDAGASSSVSEAWPSLGSEGRETGDSRSGRFHAFLTHLHHLLRSLCLWSRRRNPLADELAWDIMAGWSDQCPAGTGRVCASLKCQIEQWGTSAGLQVYLCHHK